MSGIGTAIKQNVACAFVDANVSASAIKFFAQRGFSALTRTALGVYTLTLVDAVDPLRVSCQVTLAEGVAAAVPAVAMAAPNVGGTAIVVTISNGSVAIDFDFFLDVDVIYTLS